MHVPTPTPPYPIPVSRYAAPEVAMGLPHGGKADVYSWSLLGWSVASPKQPFEGIGRSAFYDRVVVSEYEDNTKGENIPPGIIEL